MNGTIADVIDSVLPRSDVLLVVPPFAGIDRPALGVHLLQACARRAGHSVEVLYANLALASVIGEVTYEAICYAPTTGLLGERFFAFAAYNNADSTLFNDCEPVFFKRCPHKKMAIGLDEIAEKSKNAPQFVDDIASAIVKRGYKVVGCSTTFEQTSSSIAILERIKRLRSETTTILGGGNCEGEMAEGVASLSPSIDFVFSGESEYEFCDFLSADGNGGFSEGRIIHSGFVRDINELPTPCFHDYYEQLNTFLPDSRLVATNNIWLPYESSRGCWWGQKNKCTFCGINGINIKFRQKKPELVMRELKELSNVHPTNNVCMVDNVMPQSYFRELLPHIPDSIGNLHVFYEQRPNLNLEQICLLRSSGVAIIQPGIESLSNSLLKLMGKGVTVRQNLALLRYARSLGLWVNWNVLYDFPGDLEEDYEEMLRIMPLISHFHPPTGLFHLSVDRFSRYYDNARDFGIRDVRPMPSYQKVFPSRADYEKIAYHFIGDYESGAKRNQHVIDRLRDTIEKWRDLWSREDSAPPILSIAPLGDDLFLLVDTREIASSTFCFLNRERAVFILTEQRENHADEKHREWALLEGLMVKINNRFIPLATADYNVLKELETHK